MPFGTPGLLLCAMIRAVNTVRTAALAGLLLLAACSSGHGPASAPADPSAPSTAAAAVASPRCTDPGSDVLLRMKAPRLPFSAVRLGSYCGSTVQELPSTSPTGPGYCTWAAMASDNPGYNSDAVPAPPLKHVIAAIGAGC